MGLTTRWRSQGCWLCFFALTLLQTVDFRSHFEIYRNYPQIYPPTTKGVCVPLLPCKLVGARAALASTRKL